MSKFICLSFFAFVTAAGLAFGANVVINCIMEIQELKDAIDSWNPRRSLDPKWADYLLVDPEAEAKDGFAEP
ncbi:hypothetical protein M422DRAFT_780524 [Sphaerobolus stellatus SS14]|uniref:Uncharacterized protein n=1 Tax=Sphaerobolus stellatus (strain SS14) TaxID=990650 RepID=A0A0C9VSS0_SPHS4|nr:hypothetical protein M422DRAFT_780524 [Sphaerobolus stellatus SS14]